MNVPVGPNSTEFIDIADMLLSTSPLAPQNVILAVGPTTLPYSADISGPSTTFTDGLAPLPINSPISLSNTTAGGGSLFSAASVYQSGGKGGGGGYVTQYSGPWAGTSEAFLGVQFDIAGQNHLGWFDLSVQPTTPSVTIHGFAYESEAGATIDAGQTSGSAAPEPSTLLLLAAGAAGLAALRALRNRTSEAA
jgi:hypothetical protein